MKIPIELSRKESAYSVYVYGALDVRLFPNKRLNVDLKNIEIWVSHGLNHFLLQYLIVCCSLLNKYNTSRYKMWFILKEQ